VTLFVDSSTFYAGADRGDRSHDRAAAILRAGEALVTTDHILIETWLLLNGRLGRHTAERFWDGLRAGVARLESVGSADLERAWSIGLDFPDQSFSLVDRTSFAVMLRLGVLRVASLDDDFAIFRFGARRERAFEVLR
jgi:predicted nucleic acid-binding protein